MGNTIKIKRRPFSQGAAVPSLVAGELAYSEADGQLYYGLFNGNNVDAISIGGSGYIITKIGSVAPASHAITTHTANNWKLFYSDNTGMVKEVALATSGQVLKSNGANAVPSFTSDIDFIEKIDANITSTTDIGGITTGTSFPSGTTITSLLQQLLETTKHPVVTSPNVTITNATLAGSNISTNDIKEVGTTGVFSARLNYYRGNILGSGNCVSWDTTIAQTGVGGAVLYRAGTTSSVTFDGQSTSTVLQNAGYANVSTTFNSSKFIIDGDTNLTGNATYITGNIALDCKGATSSVISPNPLAGGTTANTTFKIIGRRKYFYDYSVSTIFTPTNSANIRALSNGVLATSANDFNNGQLTLNVPQFAKSIVVAYPSSWGDIEIIDNASQLNLTDNVSNTTEGYYRTVVSVVYGLNNLSAVSYNVYHYTPSYLANAAIHIVTKV